MSYIGSEPIVGNFQVCDAISVVNGQASYTMQVSSVNVTPESANHMLVSLNGILQKPNSSFTISGSTITFASNLATGDVIDFIMLLGNVLDIGIPSDSSVTDAKANFVSTSSGAGLQIKGDGTTDGTLQLNCSQNSHGIKLKSPPHSAGQSYTLTFPSTAPATDKFLQTNSSGVLSFADAGGGSWEKLGETNVTSGTASVTFDGLFSSTYANYKLIITDLVFASLQNPRLRIMISGSEESSSNYYSAHTSVVGSSSGGSADASRNWGSSSFQILNHNVSTNTADVSLLTIDIANPLYSSSKPTFKSQHAVNVSNSSQMVAGTGGYFYNSATAISGVKFFSNSGNINYGNFYLYGIKN